MTPNDEVPRPCPECGASPLGLSWGLSARPLGTWSLAGAQMKTSAVEWALVTCTGCGLRVPGRLIDPVIENGRFVGGHFESGGPVSEST